MMRKVLRMWCAMIALHDLTRAARAATNFVERAAAARRLRRQLDAKRFVYPLAVVDSEHMVTLSERHNIFSCI